MSLVDKVNQEVGSNSGLWIQPKIPNNNNSEVKEYVNKMNQKTEEVQRYFQN